VAGPIPHDRQGNMALMMLCQHYWAAEEGRTPVADSKVIWY